jgi:uncharacterized protein (DUF983 family)
VKVIFTEAAVDDGFSVIIYVNAVAVGMRVGLESVTRFSLSVSGTINVPQLLSQCVSMVLRPIINILPPTMINCKQASRQLVLNLKPIHK